MADQPLYEGLFLMSQESTGDLSGSLEMVQGILDRAEAETLVLRKWDERKLAYPIKGQKRGLFLLALFRVNGVQIANIERDCNLSDEVVRVMFTRADHMGEVEIEAEVKEGQATRDEAKLKADAAEDANTAADAEAAPAEDQPAEPATADAS